MKRDLLVLDLPEQAPPGRVAVSRLADRRITIGGIGVAGAFLVLAAAAALLPAGARLGVWLPLHLALGGAAGTAVAATLPFFAATLTAGPPAPAALRLLAIGLVVAGALGVTGGFAGHVPPLAAAGGAAYLLGLLVVLAVAVLPGRRAPRREGRATVAAYATALLEVLVGAGVATLFVGGNAAIVGDWARLKPAHAWLNLFGFLSLVISATLIHLLPTVVAARIRRRRSGLLAVVATATGAPLVAAGFVLEFDPLARAGAVVAFVGACALVAYVATCYRDRGRWTTDLGWHRAMAGHLLAAVGWFAVGVGLAAGRVLVEGATPNGWSLELVAAPLAVGWAGQAVLGAWGHLIPAIGPGDGARHARQRAILGRAGPARLLLLNGGVALLTLGLAGQGAGATLVGFAAVAAAAALELALVARALGGTGELALRWAGRGDRLRGLR